MLKKLNKVTLAGLLFVLVLPWHSKSVIEVEDRDIALLPYRDRSGWGSFLLELGYVQSSGQEHTGFLVNGSLRLVVGPFDIGVGAKYGDMNQIEIPTLFGSLALSRIWEEPYVVPYLEYGQVYSSGFKTLLGNMISVGFRVGLNFLEPITAFEARKHGGLEQTYLVLCWQKFHFLPDVGLYFVGVGLEF